MGIRESLVRKKYKGVKFERIAFGQVLLVKGTTNAQFKELKKAQDKLAEIFDVEIVNFI